MVEQLAFEVGLSAPATEARADAGVLAAVAAVRGEHQSGTSSGVLQNGSQIGIIVATSRRIRVGAEPEEVAEGDLLWILERTSSQLMLRTRIAGEGSKGSAKGDAMIVQIVDERLKGLHTSQSDHLVSTHPNCNRVSKSQSQCEG